ncbi:MAG: methyltransferase domain-containing protein [Pseudomonadota bacterium]|nr:methyltransferase domain-containing protein [Pseudomonadota bacterium]
MLKKNKKLKDNTGDGLFAQTGNWSFSGAVAKKFDNHVSKSVPLYHEGHALIAEVSEFFLKGNSICYDLGSSSGMLSIKIAQKNNLHKKIKIIGIDIEKEMVKIANKNKGKKFPNVSFIHDDIQTYKFKPADLFVSYYTMQFTREHIRQELINKIYKTLRWGGAFILYEKVRAPDARFQDMMTRLYDDFKIDNGYIPDEIIAKSRSLKGVMNPFSTKGNYDLLQRAGFKDIMTIQKYICFEGFLAIK